MRFLFLLLIITFNSFIQAQNIWMVNSTSDATAESMDVVIDAQGNSYITGYISGDTEFQDIQIDINTGYSDVIVAKINSEGKYLWVKRFSGPQSDKGAKIALTATNEIIITGTFYSSITFGGTTLISSGGSKDMFLAKLTNDGDVIWARKDGGTLGDNVYGLAVDNNNEIIFTGQFEGSANIAGQNHTSMIDPNTLLPSFDMFLAKFDSDGNPLWSKSAHAEYEDRGLAVACDNQNNIYLTGQFSDTIDFFGQTIYNQIFNAGFVSKFNAQGNFQWFDKLAAGQVLAYDVTVDAQNKIIATGDFLGQLVVWAQEGQYIVSNPYDKKVFVLKLDQQGNYQWGKAHGSNSEVSSRTICTDAQNNIYIGGHFKCNFDQYRDSTGTAHWQSAGFRDQFVTKFTSSGSTIWKNQIGGQREDQCWGIDILESDYPIITGSYATNIVYPFDDQYDYWSNISNMQFQDYSYYECLGGYSPGTIHFAVKGDESINIHVSKMISSNSNFYNYYYNTNPNDSLPILLTPNLDSLYICPVAVLCVNTQTNSCFGPLYDGSWSTGTNWINCIYPSFEGDYDVTVNRIDGCYTFDDTINIRYKPTPVFPFLTDDHDVNINSQFYQDIIACAPDTLEFYFQNLCDNCEASLVIEALNFEHELTLDSSYLISQNSYISVTITNAEGCSIAQEFNYSLIEQVASDYDTIVPKLVLNDSFDYNDSIMICRGEIVEVIVTDSLTNPNGELITPYEPVYLASSIVTLNSEIIPSAGGGGFVIHFFPNESGWYKVSHHLILGYEISNQCQHELDTTHYETITDSFYVEIKENPNLTFVGGELLCPDSYNFLSVSPVIPNLTWYGPAILWTSADSDSIKLNESGWYGVSGSFDYGEVTCPFSAGVEIDEKKPPLIIMNPVDGIVCPGDSVLLSLSESGISYEWIGPEGDLVSTDSATYVVDQGFYACIFTDEDGCQLLTAQAEIKEFITPFLVLSPTNVVCTMENITLEAIHGGLAAVNWHAPINSNQESVVVNQAGTYLCDVTQCGITVLDSITIIDGSFEVEISSTATNLCFGDTVRIQASPGLSMYEWSNDIFSSPYIDVTSSGIFSVIAFNQYGCTDTSNTITITAFPESFPPLINDTFVCVGGDISINYQSTFAFGWYNSVTDNTPFSTQNSISFTNVMNDFSVFVAHNSSNCPLNFTEVQIDVLQALTPPEIFGDTTICVFQDVNFSVNPITNGSYYWVYDGDTISNTTNLFINNITSTDPTLIEIFMNDGCTSTQNEIEFALKFPSPISLNDVSDTLCYGENLQVNASGQGNLNYFWTDGITNWTGANLNISYFEIASNQVNVYGINGDECHSDTLQFDVTLSPDADLNIQVDQLSCLNAELTISADSTLGTLIWQLPNGNLDTVSTVYFPAIQFSDEGAYIAQIYNQFSCLISDTVTIDVHELPRFSHINDSILCAESSYDLTLPSQNYTYLWNNISSETNFTPNGIDPVLLSAFDSIGCSITDTIQITLVDCSGQAANIITTNNDAINEYFTVKNCEYSYNNCIVILNRWGNVVYEKNYYRNEFNGYTNVNPNFGDKLNDGVYFYLYYNNCDNKKEITHQGYLHIVSK